MKSARRRSRELALQGLYAWQLSGDVAGDIRLQLAESRDFDKADESISPGCFPARSSTRRSWSG